MLTRLCFNTAQKLLFRRSDRLRGPGVLRESGLPEEPALPHGAAAHRHPPPEAASGHDGLLLRADEVYHRGQGTAELRSAGRIQRKVFYRFISEKNFTCNCNSSTNCWIQFNKKYSLYNFVAKL